ncbi:MAG: ATP-binding protein [Deltaproteobacteria bacterium]|nr:ATP-binding protein [Deltaproteobacteria bacterium]
MSKVLGYTPRLAVSLIRKRLASSPVVALLGPRQVGKSTLARRLIGDGDVYLDLERPSHVRRLTDPELYLERQRGRLVCLDEVQRRPDLFPVLRSIVDEARAPGQFLVLGSASPELLKQGSETLAGRLALVELAPFSPLEVADLERLWLRGGFPRSYLADDDDESLSWRLDFARTFLERDLLQLGGRIPPESVGRLWRMCAHSQGQLLNASKLGAALGVSDMTVRRWLGVLAGAFMVRLVPPEHANVKKRLIRSPKLYVRDTGILHVLLEIDSFDALLGHPVFGHSWEGFVIESVLAVLPPGWRHGFYRTQHGAEIDLVLTRGNRRIAVECKASTAPRVARGFHRVLDDLGIDHAYVAAPVPEPFPLDARTEVLGLRHLCERASQGFAD